MGCSARYRCSKHLLRVGVHLSGVVVSLWALCFLGPAEVRAARLAASQVNMTFHPDHSPDATLTCTVRNIGKEKVIWRRLSDPIPIAVGTTTFWRGSKYRVHQTGDASRLVIRNVRVADAGEYECRLSGARDEAEILSLIIPGSGHPYFSSTRTTIEAKLGDTVTLPCHVENIGKYLVLWQDADRKVLSLRKKVYSGNSRMRVVHNSPKEWSLRISNVRRGDLGMYTCVVNTSPFITRTLHLVDASDTLQPETGGSVGSASPKLKTDNFQKEVEVKQGHSVTLRCQFTGVPVPQIRWSRRVKEGDQKLTKDLKVQGEELRLKNVQPHDKGLYVCKADNGLPPVAFGKISVKVIEESPATTTPEVTTPFDPVEDVAPRLFADNAVVYQSIGDDAELRCRAVGIPRPEVHWLYNNQRLINDWKHHVTTADQSHHTKVTKLLVRSIGPPNLGSYQCKAINRHGSGTISIQLAEPV